MPAWSLWINIVGSSFAYLITNAGLLPASQSLTWVSRDPAPAS
jgi:hypothetical protein